MTCPIPENEPSRLAALHGHQILDTAPDARYDNFTGLASRLIGTPLAAISLIDRDRGWFKSRIGFKATEAARDSSFCAHAILDPDRVLVVEDAARDPRFADNPFVIGEAGIRFYAGAPIVVPDGHAIGALCVLDHQPRTMPDASLRSLRDLAAGVASLLDLHRHNILLHHFAGDPGRGSGFDGLEADLRAALANDEFHLAWQPVARLAASRPDALTGFEALLRWRPGGLRHGAAIGPGLFIPVAEAAGLVRDIDSWVLHTACRTAASWRGGRGIAVNVSADWFRDDALPGLIAAALHESRLDPARLEVEITERMLIADPERGLSIIRRIQALGVAVALDDFGSGYASLAYLMSFPFNKIKLDQAFIGELATNPRAVTITHAVLKLARQLGVTLCAEGVETPAQLAFLRAEGCDLAQGYLIGRPSRAPITRLNLAEKQDQGALPPETLTKGDALRTH